MTGCAQEYVSVTLPLFTGFSPFDFSSSLPSGFSSLVSLLFSAESFSALFKLVCFWAISSSIFFLLSASSGVISTI